MNIMNPKIILMIAIAVVIGWIAVSAIDAATEWDSPIGTIDDLGKRFTCPAPEKVALDFKVKIEAFPGNSEIVGLYDSLWVPEGVSGGPLWWWHKYDLKVEVTFEGKTKTYTETITEDYYVGLGGEDTTFIMRIVTDINNWEGECVDEWSYVQGWAITYKTELIEDGSKVLDTYSGVLTAV